MTSWKVPALAAAGIVVLTATAAAHSGGTPLPERPPTLADAVPAAAPLAAPATRPHQQASRTAIDVDPAWLFRTARDAGLPRAALRAYSRAQLASPPVCGLAWTTLAGIGWVESQHGTLDGRWLRADGRPSRPVLGPVLDGSGDVAAIQGEAAGWDRAVGPMQFLSSTWAAWARDGDGVMDPQDLDDAAAAAAAYLCADGHVLSGSGWASAVLSYNHDAGYVRNVYAAAQAYTDRTG
jgi:membrane-bound lytic murein transglycosylase B